ncbi:GNAT family N-acetyltransferase [Aquabacterium sp. A7-Y]|uniref:GNAT family N-acetyltransferase n=1 Tax=Aquabacterium sp. A7-Y TaxID=1349605 RepID=UPI00223E4889|nr:GNAT family N-acetyltransferase [Aquabacterium sp. A7-Y]MCW7537959.1 GNAT family N-acetyltransferase [Aquabacterium sp. A7-Y]
MSPDSFPDVLTTSRLVLRKAGRSDVPALLKYQIDNRTHLRRWEPFRDDVFFTAEHLAGRLAQMEEDMAAGRAVHLILRLPGDEAMVGECNFTSIVRGAFQACVLGYSLDRGFEGGGFMKEALSVAIETMFSVCKLHRIMANYHPENLRSGRLLERLGFEKEGRARAYLKINGQWADHILTSRINPAD